MAVLIPSGYAGVVPLTLTNPSSTTALGGSTTTPVGSSSTDHVVTAQLTGGQAAAVYSGALDQTNFTDVTVWWTDSGGTQHQIDVDYDTTTHGAWSSTNVTVRFRLQASIAASGSDANYLIAFGHASPNVLRNWANIYPLQDAFSGTTLSALWTPTTQSGTSLVVNNGLTLSVPAGNGNAALITSHSTFGVGYMLEWLGAVCRLNDAGSAVGAFGGLGAPTVTLGAWGANTANGLIQLQFATTTSGTKTQNVYGTADSALHWFRLARDAAGNVYGYVDGTSASSSAAPVSTSLPVMLWAWNQANTVGVDQLTAQWLKVRPWPGPGLDAQASAGGVQYRSGTVLTSTPSADPLVRAGAPSIVRSDSTHWLALYSDAVHAQSRRGTSAATLASAADQQVLASAASVRGAALFSDGAGTVVGVDQQTGGAPGVAVYSSGAWSAGVTTGLPSSALFAGDTYVSGPTTYWHLLSAAPSGTSIAHWVATTAGGPWTALSSATVVALPSSDPCLAIGQYAGKVIVCAINGSGFVTYATLDNLNATSGGSTVAASTLALSNGAVAVSENLALRNSADGGAGDLYLAYNNNLGLCVRVSAAGGPLSWSAETQVSTQASDKCPTLVRDGTGAVTLFWIGGGSGNPILSQRMQVVGGSLFLTGSTLTQTNYAANRSLLSCVPSEPSGLVGLVWLES